MRRASVGGWAAVAVGLLLLAADAPGARAERFRSDDRVTFEGCQDSFAPIPASAAEVRRYVPSFRESRYRMFGGDLGAATLVVRTFACDAVEVPGSRPTPTLGAQFGVTIESPDGTGRFLGTDACCNWYLFFWVTDNRAFARWLKHGTGLGRLVRYVKDLDYRFQPGLASTAAVHFAAGEPTPSPFELEATVVDLPDPWPGHEISPNWWAGTKAGSVAIANQVRAFRPYPGAGEIRTRPGTLMAALFDGETKRFVSPAAYGRWPRSSATKRVVAR